MKTKKTELLKVNARFANERAVTSGINISLNYGYLKSSITLKLTVYLKIWTLIYENLAFEHAVTSRVNDF